jgi:hypothetical protein
LFRIFYYPFGEFVSTFAGFFSPIPLNKFGFISFFDGYSLIAISSLYSP